MDAFLNEPGAFTTAQRSIEQNNFKKGKPKARYPSISMPGIVFVMSRERGLEGNDAY